MRKTIYSERRRRIHAFFRRTLNKSLVYQWLTKNHKILPAHADPLTGIYNQFGINTYLKELQPQTHSHYAIVLLNIDNFKEIQISYGLKAAEKALIKTASILTDNIRDTDLVGKYGEHEFILILSQIDLDNANGVAKRCLDLIQSTTIHYAQHAIQMSASCGVSASHENLLSDRVLQYADRALFLAKACGMNQLRDERAIFS